MDEELEYYSLDDEIGLTLKEYHNAETEEEKSKIAKRLQMLYPMHNEEKRIDNDYDIAIKEMALKEKEIGVADKTARNEFIVDCSKLVGWTGATIFGFCMTAGIEYISWYMDKEGVIPRSKTHVRPLSLLENSMKIFKN